MHVARRLYRQPHWAVVLPCDACLCSVVTSRRYRAWEHYTRELFDNTFSRSPHFVQKFRTRKDGADRSVFPGLLVRTRAFNPFHRLARKMTNVGQARKFSCWTDLHWKNIFEQDLTCSNLGPLCVRVCGWRARSYFACRGKAHLVRTMCKAKMKRDCSIFVRHAVLGT